MREKATAACPPANPPVLAVVSTPGAPATVPSLGQQLRDLLPARRVHSVSLCDPEANVLWLSEGALGPDEHAVVVEALEALGNDPSLPYYETVLEDGRYALVLPLRAPTGHLVGVAMILTDSKSVGDDTQERLMAAPVRAIMQRLAVLLKPGEALKAAADSRSGGGHNASVEELIPLLKLAPDITPRAARPASPPPPRRATAASAAPPSKPPAARTAAAVPEAISPEDVDDILEFELLAESAPPTRRVNGSRAHSKVDTQTDMVSLEFLPVEPIPQSPPVAPPRPPAPPTPSSASAAHTVAPAPQATASPRREGVPSAPPVAAEPRSDANLTLEVLPYAQLRPGGQMRRFQVQARLSARVAQCDPAVIDALILQRLLDWLAAHRSVWNSQPTSFTVNLSIATLEDGHFAHKVAAELNAYGISAETLGFEIAEALATQRRAQVERFIAQCGKLGTPVVIDDFSFDSQVLPLLRSKAVRLVKIDPKLSSLALKDKLSQALVIASVQAAKVLGIHCAAKRVDTQAAAQWLSAIGCDFGQGAAFAGPKPLDALVSSPDATGLTTLISRRPDLNNT